MKVQAGKPEEGVQLLRKGPKLWQCASPAPTNFYLGLGLAEIGQTAEAAQWFERSLANQLVSLYSTKCVLPVGACLSKAGSQSRCPTRSRPVGKTQNRSSKDHHAARRADNSNSCSLVSDTAAMSLLLQLRYERTRPSVSLVAAMLACISISIQAQQPPAASALLEKARQLRASHQPQAAELLLRPYLAAHPNDPETLTLSGQLRIDQGDQLGAEKQFLAALTASPNSIAPNLAMGDLLFSMHRNPEAMDRFETILAIAPANPNARHGELSAATELALTARSSGHPEVALEVLQHARKKLPDDPDLLLELGIQATELYLYPAAEEALNAARDLRPSDPGTLYALARMETERQHLPAAEADFRAYLAAQPNDASAHFGLGHVLAMQQRTAEARAEFERSIQLQPVQTESYYQIGQIELDAHQDAKADPLFRKVLERDPTHGGALTGLGVLAFRAKDYVKAEQYLAAAEKTAPNYAPAHYYRGLALTRLGRKDEGDAELREATKLGSANPSAAQPAPQTP